METIEFDERFLKACTVEYAHDGENLAPRFYEYGVSARTGPKVPNNPYVLKITITFLQKCATASAVVLATFYN